MPRGSQAKPTLLSTKFIASLWEDDPTPTIDHKDFSKSGAVDLSDFEAVEDSPPPEAFAQNGANRHHSFILNGHEARAILLREQPHRERIGVPGYSLLASFYMTGRVRPKRLNPDMSAKELHRIDVFWTIVGVQWASILPSSSPSGVPRQLSASQSGSSTTQSVAPMTLQPGHEFVPLPSAGRPLPDVWNAETIPPIFFDSRNPPPVTHPPIYKTENKFSFYNVYAGTRIGTFCIWAQVDHLMAHFLKGSIKGAHTLQHAELLWNERLEGGPLPDFTKPLHNHWFDHCPKQSVPAPLSYHGPSTPPRKLSKDSADCTPKTKRVRPAAPTPPRLLSAFADATSSLRSVSRPLKHSPPSTASRFDIAQAVFNPQQVHFVVWVGQRINVYSSLHDALDVGGGIIDAAHIRITPVFGGEVFAQRYLQDRFDEDDVPIFHAKRPSCT
ncbi:hypothetical protein DL96DRAFT_1712744 [Flagelloscypha sp. PMI_526]|nr:hypothetical protein DL96DRAFT_1712744 [Flagelloscypha sp. PMI_526]